MQGNAISITMYKMMKMEVDMTKPAQGKLNEKVLQPIAWQQTTIDSTEHGHVGQMSESEANSRHHGHFTLDDVLQPFFSESGLARSESDRQNACMDQSTSK